MNATQIQTGSVRTTLEQPIEEVAWLRIEAVPQATPTSRRISRPQSITSILLRIFLGTSREQPSNPQPATSPQLK